MSDKEVSVKYSVWFRVKVAIWFKVGTSRIGAKFKVSYCCWSRLMVVRGFKGLLRGRLR